MISEAKSVSEYLDSLPDDRRDAIEKLRSAITENLDPRFHEEMNYGMIGYVVPLDYYPSGYDCRSKEPVPLPFINLASQKNHIAVYHMGLYADEDILDWFTGEYADRVETKLDMGKSCIRFKNPARIPYGLIGELAGKMDSDRWIALYEASRKKN